MDLKARATVMMSSFRRNSVLVRLTLANSDLSAYSYDSKLLSNDSWNEENATIQTTLVPSTDDNVSVSVSVSVCDFEIIFWSFELPSWYFRMLMNQKVKIQKIRN